MREWEKDPESYRYGARAANPNGNPFDPERCAYPVWHNRGFLECQCSRRPGYGPRRNFCKAHAAALERRRRLND